MKQIDTGATPCTPPADNNYARRLQAITADLLTAEHHGRLRETVHRLYALFAELTGVDDHSTNAADYQSTLLPDGNALSPRDAARCVLDYARTAVFLRGTYAAVTDAQQRFPGERLTVLYAGCGPFAPLALPLAVVFGAERLQFTLLDIHARALESARRLVQAFGLEESICDYVQADATTYVCSPLRSPHIVIAETMQRALAREPQVAVTANLAPQLRPNGIFIPERIAVDAFLNDPATEFVLSAPHSRQQPERYRLHLGRLLELTAESAPTLVAAHHRDEAGVRHLPAVVLDIPDTVHGPGMILATSVTVFGPHALGDYDSGLTCPAVIHSVRRSGAPHRVEFRYALGSNPGFRHREHPQPEIV